MIDNPEEIATTLIDNTDLQPEMIETPFPDPLDNAMTILLDFVADIFDIHIVGRNNTVFRMIEAGLIGDRMSEALPTRWW